MRNFPTLLGCEFMLSVRGRSLDTQTNAHWMHCQRSNSLDSGSWLGPGNCSNIYENIIWPTTANCLHLWGWVLVCVSRSDLHINFCIFDNDITHAHTHTPQRQDTRICLPTYCCWFHIHLRLHLPMPPAWLPSKNTIRYKTRMLLCHLTGISPKFNSSRGKNNYWVPGAQFGIS